MLAHYAGHNSHGETRRLLVEEVIAAVATVFSCNRDSMEFARKMPVEGGGET